MGTFEKIMNASEIISQIKSAIADIQKLNESQRDLTKIIQELDRRIYKLETNSDLIKSEAKMAAVKEAQAMINSMHSQFYSELTKIAVTQNEIQSLRSLDDKSKS